MTPNQKIRELQLLLKGAREAKHHLGLSERKAFKSEIVRLRKQVEEGDRLYDDKQQLLGKLAHLQNSNAELRKQHSMLIRKLAHATDLFNQKLKELKDEK